jgi:hypothetical protein
MTSEELTVLPPKGSKAVTTTLLVLHELIKNKRINSVIMRIKPVMITAAELNIRMFVIFVPFL